MDIENKLDEEFLFYLDFISAAAEKFGNCDEFGKCEAWLEKLCSDTIVGFCSKKRRNIYLAYLVICIQNGKLTRPFSEPPPENLSDPERYFGQQQQEIKEPEWLVDLVAGGDDIATTTDNGRTYLATKALPEGMGAMGYIAVSLDDTHIDFTGRGFNEQMEQNFRNIVPPLSEVERIIINRRNPDERQRIIMFYETFLQNLTKEIQGEVPIGTNPQIANLISQLENDLKQKDQFTPYLQMSQDDRKLQLMHTLDSRLRARLHHVRTREQFLDNAEQQAMNASFWENSMIPEDLYKEDKKAYAVQMWEQAITAGPKKKFMELIVEKYPPFVIKKFLELLANAKEKIAVRIQRRHENIVSQLKKELRKEGTKGRQNYEDSQYTCDELETIYGALKDAHQKAVDSRRKRQEHLYGHRKERDEMYEQVRRAMIETQQHVEEEAELGKFLTEQINDLNAQSEIYQQVNEESIQKIEDSNITIMNNIQRLNKAIRNHENRISTMKQLLKQSQSATTEGAQFMYL